jgi:adenylate cyclase
MSRFEGKEIPIEEAENYCYFVKRSHRQIRFEVKIGNHTYEVDEFYGANEGLTVAEIELESESETHETKLAWNRVTNDNRYYNSNLSNNPFENWC